jgi:hypothetical protein
MKRIVVTAALFLLTATAATAGPGGKGVLYQFRGHLRAASAGSVSLTVEGGNHRALQRMLGASVDQSFALGSATEFLKWANGIPTVVGPGDLAPGDVVVVKVRAPRGADLAAIESQPAGIVADRGPNPNPPDKPLYLYRGQLTSVGTSSVTVAVKGGNHRGLRLLLGTTGDQTFTTGSDTIFLLWQGKVPTVIQASQLKVGDRITVRIRAAAKSTLAEVEATPAVHVGDHEPATSTINNT